MIASNETIYTQHGCASTYILHVHQSQVHVVHGKIDENHGTIKGNHGEKSMNTMEESIETMDTLSKQTKTQLEPRNIGTV